MSDILTQWSGTHGDWVQRGVVLASGSDIVTAVLISLFTDREAADDDAVPDGSADPRGWWGDAGQYLIGSRLWMLERSKRTQETLQQAQGYAAEALQWLIDDGVVASFDIYCEWTAASTLGMRVTAFKNDGQTEAMNFAWAWST